MIEYRPFFRENSNDWFLGTAYLSIDIFFPYEEKENEDGDLVLQSVPCPFLDLGDHRCSIYEDRPAACREYPHTDRKHMAAILPLTARNAHVCPAVAEIALRIAGVT